MSQGISFDRRRINGPEESFPLSRDGIDPSISLNSRVDRDPSSIRPIYLKTGLINQANGSAYIETHRTKIACAVYGPRPVSKSTAYSELGKVNVDVKFAPFSCTQRRVPNKDSEDRFISILIQQSLTPSLRLELLPKSVIDVYITILENDGIEGCVSAGVIAATSALGDAGIEMIGLVTACAASWIGEELRVDPSAPESEDATGTVVVACIPAVGTITNTWQIGHLTPPQMIRCVEQIIARCADIHQIAAQALREGASMKS